MVLVNKIRVLGSEDWNDSKVTRLFMRAYKEKDMGLARMIRDRDDYEEMTPHQLFAKIQQHESEEAPTKAKDSNALVANEQESVKKSASSKDHKHKKVIESSSDDDSSSDDLHEEAAMFIKTFKKLAKRSHKFQRKNKKRACYECGQTGHFIADCPNKKDEEGKKEYKKDKYNKGEKSKGHYKKKKYGQAHIGEEWDSNEESSSLDEEGVASIAIQRSSSTPRLFTNFTDNINTPTCLMAKGEKVHLFDASTFDGINDEHSMKNKMINEFCLNGYNIITKLMEKLEKRKATLVAQEDLLILEKERNLELQKVITNKDEMLETLTKELSLVKVALEENVCELSCAKTSIVGLVNTKEALEANLSCLKVQNQELQVKLDTLKTTTTSSLVINSDASSSSSNACKNCSKYHANCCLANHVKKVYTRLRPRKF
jgi:hypothetical protein